MTMVDEAGGGAPLHGNREVSWPSARPVGWRVGVSDLVLWAGVCVSNVSRGSVIDESVGEQQRVGSEREKRDWVWSEMVLNLLHGCIACGEWSLCVTQAARDSAQCGDADGR